MPSISRSSAWWMWPQTTPCAPRLRASRATAFYTDTDAWKGQVISQARQAMFQAVQGMAG